MHTLLELMDNQLKIPENEWNDYNNYLQKLEQSDDTPNIEKGAYRFRGRRETIAGRIVKAKA